MQLQESAPPLPSNPPVVEIENDEPEIVLQFDDDDDNVNENDEPPPNSIIDTHPTFLQYISGGCEFRVIIAIVLTSSNGNTRDEQSLHYFDDHNKNGYEESLYSICTILLKYDSYQKYPVYGFGIKHCSIDNNDSTDDRSIDPCYRLRNDDADGADGILQLYRKKFRSGLIMVTTRHYASVIEQAGKDALENFDKHQSYTILLLFTNGCPDDYNETIKVLNDVDNAPLSIVIIGVGENNIEQLDTIRHIEDISTHTMDTIDDNETGQRDKVRLLHMNHEIKQDYDKLTSAALDTIPKQLETYFHRKGIYLNAPIVQEENNDHYRSMRRLL